MAYSFIWLLSLVLALQLTQNLSQNETITKRTNNDKLMQQINNYEYCVKIVMVCSLVFDSPHDYDEVDESDINKDPPLDSVDEQFHRANCVPKNLTGNDLKIYWKTVRKWQDYVKELLLSTNIFSIKEELDNGNAIKINLWHVFKIRKFVICNRTDDVIETKTTDYHAITTTTEKLNSLAEDNLCDEKQQIGIWINEQINTGENMDNLMQVLPDILAKLELQINRNCCPYPILRDRVEVINDYVDTIMQFKSLEMYERVKSTGSALLDVRNLKIRLEYLNQTTSKDIIVTTMCCNNWDMLMNGAKYKIQVNIDYAQGILASRLNYSTFNQYLNVINESLIYQQNRSKSLDESRLAKLKNEEICCQNDFNDNINTIKSIINDMNLYDIKSELSKDLIKKLMSFNDAVETTKIQFNNEQKKVNYLNSVCTDKCVYKQKVRNQIKENNQKFDNLDRQMKELSNIMNNKSANTNTENVLYFKNIASDGSKKLQDFKAKLDEILSHSLRTNVSYSRANNLIQDSSNVKELNNCLDRVKQLTELQELAKVKMANMTSHSKTKLETEKTLKNLNDKLNEFIKQQPNENKQRKVLSSLEKRMEDIIQIKTNSTKAEDGQSQKIMELEIKLNESFADERNVMKTADNVSAESKTNIEKAVFDFEKKIKEVSSGFNENSNHNNLDVFSKLDYLEAVMKNMTDQGKNREKRMLDKLADLQNRLMAVNENLNKSEAAARKCNGECDFGELPSIEELEGRLIFLKSKLKKN